MMGCRTGLQWVSGGAFVWHHGGWHHGRAHVQWVGVVGLACCVGVVRFLCSGFGLWWGLLWWGLCKVGWHCGEVFMGQVGVKVRLACCVGTVLKQCCGKSCMA